MSDLTTIIASLREHIKNREPHTTIHGGFLMIKDMELLLDAADRCALAEERNVESTRIVAEAIREQDAAIKTAHATTESLEGVRNSAWMRVEKAEQERDAALAKIAALKAEVRDLDNGCMAREEACNRLSDELTALKAKRTVKLPQRWEHELSGCLVTDQDGDWLRADDVIKMLWDAGITPGETL